jgi:ribose-phosphate pyrophosphokinase
MQMISAARIGHAHRITVVIPFYGYSQQDRKDMPGAAITAADLAKCFTVLGADQFVLLDPHSSVIETVLDSMSAPTDRLWARIVFGPFLKSHPELFPCFPHHMIVLSPDVGAVQLNDIYAKIFEEYPGQIPRVSISKSRVPGESKTDVLIVNGASDISSRPGVDVLVIDDLVQSGGTLSNAAREAKTLGAGRVFALETHAVLWGQRYKEVLDKLEASPIDRIFVTDSIRRDYTGYGKITVVSVAPVLADVIWRVHTSKSVSFLFE